MSEVYHDQIHLPVPTLRGSDPRSRGAGSVRLGRMQSGSVGLPNVASGLAMGGPALAAGLGQWADAINQENQRKRNIDTIEETNASRDRERLMFEEISQLRGEDAFEAPGIAESFYEKEDKYLQSRAVGEDQKL